MVLNMSVVYETPQTAPYRYPLAPQLNAAMGQAPNPRMVVGPVQALPEAPNPIPTTSKTIKKSNVQIPYTRVVADERLLDEPATIAFVFADRAQQHTHVVSGMDRVDRVVSLDTVNKEIQAPDLSLPFEERVQIAIQYRPDGILLSTESRTFDPERHAFPDQYEQDVTTSSILIAIQGPALLRNDYVITPLHGEMLYVGLVYEKDRFRWIRFCSQHLDIRDVNARIALDTSRLAKVGRDSKPNTRTCKRDEFTLKTFEFLVEAYTIGKIMDTNPAPGCVTVNVQIHPVTINELGLKHDFDDSTVNKSVVSESAFDQADKNATRQIELQEYIGFIGSLIPPPQPQPAIDVQSCLNNALKGMNGLRQKMDKMGTVAAFLQIPWVISDVPTPLGDEADSHGVWRQPVASTVPSPTAIPTQSFEDAIEASAYKDELRNAAYNLRIFVHCVIPLIRVFLIEFPPNTTYKQALSEASLLFQSITTYLTFVMEDDVRNALLTRLQKDDWLEASADSSEGFLSRLFLVSYKLEAMSASGLLS